MHPQPLPPLRFTTVISTSLLIALIVITSDVTIAAGLARDVIAAIGQHLVALGSAAWHARPTQTFNQECPRCQSSRRDRPHPFNDSFPAFKDATATKASRLNGIIIH
jgi:hypothetical protein